MLCETLLILWSFTSDAALFVIYIVHAICLETIQLHLFFYKQPVYK